MARKKSEDVAFDFASYMRDTKVPTAEKLTEQQDGYRCYSTGCFMLDLAINEIDFEGNIGIPERTVVEIYGKNQAFKTGTAEHLMKSVLDADPTNIVVALYSEEPDTDRFDLVGIDRTRVACLSNYMEDKPGDHTAEKQLDIIKKAITDPRVKLVVVDSIRALMPEKQFLTESGEIIDLDEKRQMGYHAKLVHQFIKEFINLNKNAILFMTNQQYASMSLYGEQSLRPNTSGGTAVGYYSNLRILTVGDPIYTDKEHPITLKKLQLGWDLSYRIVKNKFSNRTGDRSAHSRFLYDGTGFQTHEDILKCALYLGLVTKKPGARYHFAEHEVHGESSAEDLIRTNAKVQKELRKKITERRNELFEFQDGEMKAEAVLL